MAQHLQPRKATETCICKTRTAYTAYQALMLPSCSRRIGMTDNIFIWSTQHGKSEDNKVLLTNYVVAALDPIDAETQLPFLRVLVEARS